jgi:endonuclease-3
MIAPNPGFPIEEALDRVAGAVSAYPMPSMFELAGLGHTSLFEQVVGCIISTRTLEETSLPASVRLFSIASTPYDMVKLPVERIVEAIADSTCPEQKAPRILAIARFALDEHGGVLPCDRTLLETLPGVGPKCAALALGIACRTPALPVDIHVHRIANRWGVIATKTPERSMTALESILPPERWLETNRLLVPFGKHVCTGTLPRCSRCPVAEWCERVGVTRSR